MKCDRVGRGQHRVQSGGNNKMHSGVVIEHRLGLGQVHIGLYATGCPTKNNQPNVKINVFRAQRWGGTIESE